MDAKHCIHIKSSIGINREFIKSKKNENKSVFECLECSAIGTQGVNKLRDNWICLTCGQIFCSRYVNQHAKNHWEATKHNVTISLNTSACYCYECDEFVDNEDDLSEFRQELNTSQDVTSDSETSLTLEEVSTNKSTIVAESQETVSTSSCDSGLDSLQSGVNLRPRKRTRSTEDSDSQKNGRKKVTNGKKKGVGLKNLGNTCFMNSVLQSLHNIQQFTLYFSNLPKIEQPKPRPYYSRSIKENLDEIFLVEELRKVLIDLNSGADNNKASISPECLFLVIWKVVPQFKGYHQHDAHEFLRYMLDRLHTELQNVPNALPAPQTNSKMKNYICPTPVNKGTSFVTNVFGGTLLSEVRCLVCGQESKKHDPFLDLSLDIPEKYYKDVDDMEKKQPFCDITDCLSSFVSIEELTETELYHCSNCKKKQRSTKRFWIRRLPNVLCLHIKRFRWNSYYRTKIDLRIHFPITALDLSKFVLNSGPETRRSNASSIYDLAAVIVHHGSGTSNGHYTSYAYNNGVWMHFNDSSVKEVSEEIVADCKPYILFYTKREGDGSDSS